MVVNPVISIKTGKVVIEWQFDQATSFSEGLAAVKVGNKWGYRGKPLP